MTEPFFFDRGGGLTVAEIAALLHAEPRTGAVLDRRITGIAALDRAGPSEVAFLDKPKYASQLPLTGAGLCLTTERYARQAPDHLSVLCLREPYRAFVELARALFPDATRPSSLFEGSGNVAAGATVHPTARLEPGVTIDPGVVIGPAAEIGAGTAISAGAVIGPRVRIGRQCAVGANASITHSLIGDRVVIHPLCAIGQDGFGYVMGAAGHRKVLQLGRVVIQDDVEIGAGTTIDRGANRDTVIGEGTKIDNLVQIGHNVTIGRHCIIVSQCGISGSVVIEDRVILAGQVGLPDNVTIGEGAIVGAQSGVMSDIPAGEKWLGYPAMRGRDFLRSMMTLRRWVEEDGARDTFDRDDEGPKGHDGERR
ncbi:MAG: UDP-3-O-(3-hydroxymyristoyl)glucosamine N-acyltransferase [Hyphomicrobiales bacterium]|nr:UDP-3-O-(3-hydroxymyristoyl)glucosamine N-acyltransferase [Hyphomicrobiales bacterium]